jgi:hypothetical protein
MTVQIIKLITGEEVIGDVTSGGSLITLKRPCVLQLMPSRADPERPMLGLVPYAIYAENHTITINDESVVWMSKPVDELYNQYQKAFGSGLII